LLGAETFRIAAEVLDRADNGAAIRGQFVYPSVELSAGETGRLHVGEVLAYPVGMRTVDMGGGVTRDEPVLEESPVE